MIIVPNGFANNTPQGIVMEGKKPLKYGSLQVCAGFMVQEGHDPTFDLVRFKDRLESVRKQAKWITKNGDIPYAYRSEIIDTISALVNMGALTPKDGILWQEKYLKV